MSVRYHAAITLALLLVSGCGADSEVDADADAPPVVDGAAAMRPEAGPATLIGPGTLSTDEGESWISFNPEQSIAVFGRHNANWGDHQVHMALRTEDGWSEPQLAPFSGSYADRGARFSVDGGVVFYSSNRPRAGQDEQALDHFDIWLIQLHEDGWGQPRPLPAPLNTTSNEIHPSVALDGTVYFASDREGGLGGSDLYKATPGPTGYAVESLGPTVNSEHSEADVFVDPQQRFLIFARTDDPEGFGGDDLWLSVRQELGWSTPVNLGPEVNSPEYEYGPALSADGRTLYFTSHRDGDGDLFQIDAAHVGIPVYESN
jgi:hypothetical protein